MTPIATTAVVDEPVNIVCVSWGRHRAHGVIPTGSQISFVEDVILGRSIPTWDTLELQGLETRSPQSTTPITNIVF